MRDPLIRILIGDDRPTAYWVVTWSFDSATDVGTYQYFTGPADEAREAAYIVYEGLLDIIDPAKGFATIRKLPETPK